MGVAHLAGWRMAPHVGIRSTHPGCRIPLPSTPWRLSINSKKANPGGSDGRPDHLSL